jgi:hypothetical protein
MSQGNGQLGRTLRLTLPRQYIVDLLHFSKKIPSIPVQRQMDLGSTVAARNRLELPPSWVVIFAKAFSITCLEFPELRRTFLAFPYARLFEYVSPVASIAVEKQVGSESAIAFLRLGHLHCNRLQDLDKILRQAREEPIEAFRSYRTAKAMYWLPTIARRALWWLGLNISARLRANQFGTFGMSVYASLGAESLHPISPLTCTLNYGPITCDGRVTLRIVYDHRVLDGATVARAMSRMENVLTSQITQELNDMQVRCNSSAA